MKIEKMLVTGDALFLRRYQPLFEEIASQCQHLNYLRGDQQFNSSFLNLMSKVFNKLIYIVSPSFNKRLHKNSKALIKKSKWIESKIREIENRPDFVLHVFGMYGPFWDVFDIPYGMYLDYTMTLAYKNYTPWAPFETPEEFSDWLNCERLLYERATHLFAMSRLVKSSLVDDYGISPEKITVVGSFANRHAVYEGEKKFGSKQILFNASQFERKGGDLVLEAFKQVKLVVPEAKLVVIGKKLNNTFDGITNPGRIASTEEMRQLFLKTDLVLAPGRCDPFPSFVIEAMNYGIPCIVSDNDGMPEIVDHGINGLVVDSLTPEAIAKSVIDLIEDIPTLVSMSQQARQKVKAELNRHSVATKIMQAIAVD
ncbi:MAG: hypothetical protein DCF20_00810 [Pseudanabaena sp.]|nr:MAG: hypothetical protein DCF20_00810 [Pseudanabaena sp.]